MIDFKAIITETHYQEALKEIETLMMSEADTQEGKKLDVMVTLVEAYEAKHSSLNAAEALKT